MISTSFTKFVFFRPIGKTRWPPLPLIGWDIFDFSSETADRNSTKLDRKQDLNVHYQVCVFWADQKNNMAALASDWLRHFWLLLWNRWIEFNETWQEASSQHPLPSVCFLGQSEKQDGSPGLRFAETFFTSPLKPLNGIQRNLTGSKISTSSTKIVFLGPIGKTRWPPWLLIGWDIFNFSSKTAERNLRKLQEARSQHPLPSLCFSSWSEKQDGRPGLWLAETFSTSPLKPLNGIQWNLTGRKISTSSTKFVFFGLIRKQDGRPGFWLAETFLTSSLKLLNGIRWNLTGNKISTSSTKFVFFGLIKKIRWPPWPICQKGGILYSGAQYVALFNLRDGAFIFGKCVPYDKTFPMVP